MIYSLSISQLWESLCWLNIPMNIWSSPFFPQKIHLHHILNWKLVAVLRMELSSNSLPSFVYTSLSPSIMIIIEYTLCFPIIQCKVHHFCSYRVHWLHSVQLIVDYLGLKCSDNLWIALKFTFFNGFCFVLCFHLFCELIFYAKWITFGRCCMAICVWHRRDQCRSNMLLVASPFIHSFSILKVMNIWSRSHWFLFTVSECPFSVCPSIA